MLEVLAFLGYSQQKFSWIDVMLPDQTDLDRMVHVVRHRLRNHVSGMRTALTLLEQELGDGKTSICEYFPLLQRECNMIDELACRIGYALESQAEGPVSEVTGIVKCACDKVLGKFPSSVINVSCDNLEGVLVRNSLSFERCLVEVLTNALEAGGDRFAVLRACLEDDMVKLSIENPAGPLDDEVFAGMLKLFFTTKSRRAGLGLNIAENAVVRSGGRISLERKEGHAGLVVHLAVPRCGAATGEL
jgi:signal transduction histidine kinase